MSKNYAHSYYLKSEDIAHLLDNYHQGYCSLYPTHLLPQQDNRFWQNEAGELLFYAGEQALLEDKQSEAQRQPLGRGLYTASLDITACFLELNLPELPSDTIHIMSLINLNRGHWTSVVLSIKDLNKQQYKAIYDLYQEFKQYLRDKNLDPNLGLGKMAPGIFIQYATGNRHGDITSLNKRNLTESNQQDKENIENILCAFFQSKNQGHLLDLKGQPDKNNYIEGNLSLVLAPNDPKNANLYHFDSMFVEHNHARVRGACARFLAANHDMNYDAPKNLQVQTGATCGEHAILNGLKYVFFTSTHGISSVDLRRATNYFCPEFARLFLFGSEPGKVYQEEFDLILAQQMSKNPEIPSSKADAEVKAGLNPADYLVIGLLMGVALNLVVQHVIAPALGMLNPFFIACASVVLAIVSAIALNDYIEEIDKTDKKDLSEEQRQLEAQSLRTLEAEKQAKKSRVCASDLEPAASSKSYLPLLSEKQAGLVPNFVERQQEADLRASSPKP